MYLLTVALVPRHAAIFIYVVHAAAARAIVPGSSPVFPFRMILRKMNMAYAIANICFLKSSSESRKRLQMALKRGPGKKSSTDQYDLRWSALRQTG